MSAIDFIDAAKWSNHPVTLHNFEVPWNTRKLTEQSHFSGDVPHGIMDHPTEFQVNSWNP